MCHQLLSPENPNEISMNTTLLHSDRHSAPHCRCPHLVATIGANGGAAGLRGGGGDAIFGEAAEGRGVESIIGKPQKGGARWN